MDHPQFDALARRLAAGATRRAGLKAALGGLLGAGVAALAKAGEGEAKKKHRKKKRNALCSGVCPSGSACVNGACACTRELCGGRCCHGSESCQDGACVFVGLRDCRDVAIVDGADLSWCDLAGKEITNRTLKNVNFMDAHMPGARFTGKFQPWNCRFDDATLEGANFDQCDIKPGTTFIGANLRGAIFTAGHIEGSDFSDASMVEAQFSGTMTWDDPTRISNTLFVQTDLSNAVLRRTHFDGARFTPAVLSGAILSGAQFTNSDVSGANFAGAHLAGTNFVDTKLDGARLDGATVGKWDSGGTGYWTNFQRCSMKNVWMQHQRKLAAALLIPDIRFEDVDLRYSVFVEPYGEAFASWLRTDLTGATGWQQPNGGYRLMCDVTLPDGSKAPNTSWIGGAACPQA